MTDRYTYWQCPECGSLANTLLPLEQLACPSEAHDLGPVFMVGAPPAPMPKLDWTYLGGGDVPGRHGPR